MNKRCYFLSILILFLFNIGGVNAVTSHMNFGNSTSANSYCVGDNCTLPISNEFTSWSIPGGLSGTFYMYIDISPDTVGVTETEYRNAVVEYHYCISTASFNFNITSNHTPPWKYSYNQSNNKCVGKGGESGFIGTFTMFSDFSGLSSGGDFAKVTAQPASHVNAWWAWYLGYDIYKLDTYYELKEQEKINSNLNDLNDKQQQTNDKIDNLNDNITDSDSSEASGEAGDFFSNFNTDTFGLTSVITAPLELIKSVTSKSCSPLQLTLPFVDEDLNLPCLSSIYETHFGSFLTIYRTITFGFVSYWVCIKIFNLVKDFKNPEHDEIEVLDL